ncbi:hypothetical protein CKA32_001306 [Geitlerinema sp. FC II]|nr:hypothetical protein CKA32_001306 [Geitlerinema sp. FC II]
MSKTEMHLYFLAVSENSRVLDTLFETPIREFANAKRH